jgi:cytochrome P450
MRRQFKVGMTIANYLAFSNSPIDCANENNIATADAYGHSARVRKFEGYKVLATHAPNILTLTDKAQHARRRRVVSQAFSESSLKMFEPILLSKMDIFCQGFRAQQQDNTSKWTGPYDMARECKQCIDSHWAIVPLGSRINPRKH